MARRYRIHFSAKFDYDIEADHILHAKAIAAEMSSNPTISMVAASAHQDLRCAWVTITPLTPAGVPSDVVFEEKRIDDG